MKKKKERVKKKKEKKKKEKKRKKKERRKQKQNQAPQTNKQTNPHPTPPSRPHPRPKLPHDAHRYMTTQHLGRRLALSLSCCSPALSLLTTPLLPSAVGEPPTSNRTPSGDVAPATPSPALPFSRGWGAAAPASALLAEAGEILSSRTPALLLALGNVPSAPSWLAGSAVVWSGWLVPPGWLWLWPWVWAWAWPWPWPGPWGWAWAAVLRRCSWSR